MYEVILGKKATKFLEKLSKKNWDAKVEIITYLSLLEEKGIGNFISY